MSARGLKLFGARKQGNITINTVHSRDNSYEYITVRLHRNKIAHIDYVNRMVTIDDRGWNTLTTKTAINNVLRQLGLKSKIFQKKHIWYINVPSDMYMNATSETIVFDGNLTLKF